MLFFFICNIYELKFALGLIHVSGNPHKYYSLTFLATYKLNEFLQKPIETYLSLDFALDLAKCEENILDN